MPCIAAFIILGFLSIFSVKYRAFAKEAFDCVFRRVTFRSCQTAFGEKIKAVVSAWFLKRNEKIGRFVFRRFEILNWIFVILFFASAIYAGRSVYLYAKYGSCTPEQPQNCIINKLAPAGSTSPALTPDCLDYKIKPR